MRFARMCVYLFLSALSLSAAVTSESAPDPHTNVFLRKTVLTTGAIVVGMSNYYFASVVPSDSFTLQKQVFIGSTTCDCTTDPMTFLTTCPNFPTHGGTVTYVQNVSAAWTASTFI